MRPQGVSAQLVTAGVLPDAATGALACMHLDAVPLAPGLARQFVASHLPDATVPQREAAVLLTSELVTRAVLAARSSLEVGVATVDGRVIVAVSDPARSRTSRRSSEPAPSQHASGLLMKALADEHGSVPHDQGRTDWAVLNEHGRASTAGELSRGAAGRR